MGAWIAVTARFEPATWLLGLGVLAWGSANDLFISSPDAEFDRQQGLYSVPGCFGVPAALRLAALLHAGAVLLWAAFAWVAGLGPIFWVALLLAGALLAYEHRLVSPDDLSRVGLAFGPMNIAVSCLLLAGGLGDLYVL